MSGKFEAVVDGGSDTKTNSLSFSLRGDGILPRIKILQPSETDADGRAWAKFGRLLVGKSVSRQVVILNDGIIPALVRVDTMVSAPPSIQFTGRGVQFKLAPGEQQVFELTFNPREAGAAACEIKIAVQQNQFEDSVISVSGDAYERDLSFEDLGGQPNSDSDKLVFGGTPVCVPITKTFTIQNRTSQSQKFEWPEHHSLSFVPRIGHLLPHGSKQITATFESKKKLELVDEKVELSLKVIEHAGEVVEWDESSTTVSWVAVGKDGADSLENTSSSQTSPKRRGNKKVVEPTPEPEVTVKQGSDQSVPLMISANSDALVYELGTDSIKLKSTMMFQTRAFSFPFKNTSTVPLEYSWAFEKTSEDPWEVAAQDGSEPVPLPDPFTVEPATGSVAPGQTINVQVHFSPQEAGSYSRRLFAKIPHLDSRPPPGEEPEPVVEAAPAAVDPKAKGKAPVAPAPAVATKIALPDVMQPPSLSVTARAMRPLCHFELVESDWISGGRRPSGLPGPGGKSSLDPSTRVVEFESLGTKVRNTKRFFVTNPTNQSYEYTWECEDGTGAAALLQQRTFRCAQRKGTVLAGKKAEMVFEYTPEEDMLLESF
jgi:hydrocephalus-inducing protein